MDINTLRRKTIFVVHALEQELAALALRADVATVPVPDSVLAEIRAREAKRTNAISTNDLASHLEAAYLSELFKIAHEKYRGTSLELPIKSLRSLCEALQLYDIRNAVSHPTRAFAPCYWYRAAAIAADPLVHILGFGNVSEALLSAEAGTLSDPPAEWVEKFAYSVPSNLPKEFPHAATKLIGRDKELDEFLTRLASGRNSLVAVVGWGGLGKTALVLEALNTVIASPSWSKEFDAVCFLTMKEAELNFEGVRNNTDHTTLDGLHEALIAELIGLGIIEDELSSEELRVIGEPTRLLLFVDNIETALRDRPEVFFAFIDSLPPRWKIVVTSRVLVDGAVNIPLPPLRTKQSEQLARRYAGSTGFNVSQAQIDTAVEGSGNNPLALRLILDGAALGRHLHDAVSIAKDRVVEFAFSHLVETLPELATRILDLCFLHTRLTRDDIVSLLNVSADELAQALGALLRTSLVQLKLDDSGAESIDLAATVRDFVRTSAYCLRFRHDNSAALRQRQKLLETVSARDPRTSSNALIPTDSPEALKELLLRAELVLKSKGRTAETVANLIRRFGSLESSFFDDAAFHFWRGKLLESVRDPAAIAAFEQACRIDGQHDAARVEHGRLLSISGRYGAAIDVLQPVLDGASLENETFRATFGQRACISFLVSLRNLEKYDLLHFYAERCLRFEDLSQSALSFWVSAIRHLNTQVHEDTDSQLIAAFSRVERTLLGRRPNRYQAVEIAKLVTDCVHKLEHYDGLAFKEPFIAFVNRLFPMACSVLPDEVAGSLKVPDLSRSLLRMLGDDVRGAVEPVLAHRSSGSRSADMQELSERGFVYAEVYNIPISNGKGAARYAFARDTSGRQYYLNFDRLTEPDWDSWQRLSIGSGVALLPGEENLGKATPAEAVVIL